MKRKGIIVTSIFVSVFLHVLFFGSSYFLWVPGASGIVEKTHKMFQVKSSPEMRSFVSSQSLVESYVKKMKFEQPDAQLVKEAGKKMRQIEKIEMPVKPDVPAEKEVEIGGSQVTLVGETAIKEEVKIKKRMIVDKNTLSELEVWEEMERFGSELNQTIELPTEFLEEMAAFTPSISSSTPQLPSSSLNLPAQGYMNSEKQAEDLDQYLRVKVTTYRTPEDGKGYYQLSISPGPAAGSLEIVPKEVVFLVDASLSIKRKRLNSFINGIEYSIQNLNPGDKFNIYAFKEEIVKLSPSAISSEPANIKKALNFLGGVRAGQRTDLYQAFLQSIRSEASQFPSYLILMSDGRANTGITSPIQIITEISEINNKSRSIFSFSGGARVNRFLLDFLSYQNRGWSEYAKDEGDITRKVSELYDKIRNPILLNAQFQVVNLEQDSIYPRHLPDFYLDTEFKLFGTFEKEGPFSVRLMGQANGKPKELIFSGDFSQASAGNSDIARHWAFNKIYHLMSEITRDGYNREKIEEIKHLSKRFKIRTPYLF